MEKKKKFILSSFILLILISIAITAIAGSLTNKQIQSARFQAAVSDYNCSNIPVTYYYKNSTSIKLSTFDASAISCSLNDICTFEYKWSIPYLQSVFKTNYINGALTFNGTQITTRSQLKNLLLNEVQKIKNNNAVQYCENERKYIESQYRYNLTLN